VGDLKNDVWHKVVYDGIDTPMIYEMRKVKGIFLENLELNDFPVDVQVRFTHIISYHFKFEIQRI
jgi:hypothetical protein